MQRAQQHRVSWRCINTLLGLSIGIPFPRKARRVVIKDSFNRADNATSLGSTETGQAWQPLNGTWGISNGKAYSVSDNSDDICVFDVGKSDFSITCTFNCQTNGTNLRVINLIFRVLDAGNFLMTRENQGALELYKRVGGSFTQLASTPYGLLDNTDYTLTVLCSGNQINVYINGGAAKIAYTLSGSESAFASYTKAGLRLTKAGLPTNPARADNLFVEV